jgi:peptide-methionine (S)-S-oxide reductase
VFFTVAHDPAQAFPGPIVTEVMALGGFRLAPPDQQDYVARNPTALYVLVNDLPKLDRLRRMFPALYRDGAPGR